MTKLVRIENADNAPYKVVVEIWDKARAAYTNGAGIEVPAAPDTLVRTINLDSPTAMTDNGCYLTSSRYIIVKEAE